MTQGKTIIHPESKGQDAEGWGQTLQRGECLYHPGRLLGAECEAGRDTSTW